MTILERGLISKGLVSKGLVDGLISPPLQRWVYNFDGVDDYGVLQDRAINVDEDIDIEFYSSLKPASTIISQQVIETESLREFHLLQTSATGLNIVIGGVFRPILSLADGYRYGVKYFLKITGVNFTIAENTENNIIKSGTIVRGSAREPSATTMLGAWRAGPLVVGHFQGPQYNLKINGVLWEIRNNGNTIQPSTPAGNNMTLVNVNPDRWSKIPV